MQQNDLDVFDTVAACNKGAEIELRNPNTQQPIGVFITILGKDSDVFRERLRQNVNDDLRRAAMAKKRGRPEEVGTVEKMETRGIELLVACTTGWRWGEKPVFPFKKKDQLVEELPFSAANAQRVYSEFPAVKAQVDEGIADLENFI